ncbi:MAG: hypothetical protein R6X02_12075 [Enhygromyxa sp.]
MSAKRSDRNTNLEFVIERRAGVPAPDGTAVTVNCELSDCPQDDCPGIGG